MPIPIRQAAPPGSDVQPYYVRDRQTWAIDQEHLRHNQALYSLGEYAMFVLMWHINDFIAGRVVRCRRCYGVNSADPIRASIASTYSQPETARCPDCYGTTFEGGIRARIVRPAIFSDADEDEQRQARGISNPQAYDVESTSDFRVRTFDYVFRLNGDRLQLRVPQRVTLRTGFGPVHQSTAAIGYNHARANLEDKASVAYDIPPTEVNVSEILTRGLRFPYDFTSVEQINSSLIPAEDD